MIEQWLTILQHAGDAIYAAFVWPGDYLLSHLSTLAPECTASLDAQGVGTSVVIVLAAIYWVLVFLTAAKIVKLCRHVARIIRESVRMITFRITLSVHNVRTRLQHGLRQSLSRRKSLSSTDTPSVEFDELDLGILKSAVAKGPGFALSAPELAEEFALRPAQVQRSLDKLCKCSMIDTVIGSTEGFGNYRLTQSGTEFMAMWQRQQTHAPSPGSAAVSPV